MNPSEADEYLIFLRVCCRLCLVAGVMLAISTKLLKVNTMNIETSYNFRKIHEQLTTSGVVEKDCLKTLASQGYEVVVNLMPDSSKYAVADERKIIEFQEIEYIYIPVDFEQPKRSDFLQFSSALDRISAKKVHLHCAANYRVSAFLALYATLHGYWSPDQAWHFIYDVWQPAEHPGWSEFINRCLQHGI